MLLRYLVILLCTIAFFSTSIAQQKEQVAHFQKHYVRDRETASSIASNFNVKLKDFLMLNNFPNDVKLKPGQLVLIKQLKDGEKVADEKPYVESKPKEEAVSKVDEEDETRSVSEAPVETKKPAKAPAEEKKETKVNIKTESNGEILTGPNGTKYEVANEGFHIVQKGQTFYHIALIYHLTVDQLKALNNMTNTDIKIGQKLKISK